MWRGSEANRQNTSTESEMLHNVVCQFCTNYFLIAAAGNGTTGMVSYTTGPVGIGEGEGISEDGKNWRAETKYQGLETRYAYFKRILADDPQEFTDWGGGEPVQSSISDTLGSPDPETELTVRSRRVLQL